MKYLPAVTLLWLIAACDNEKDSLSDRTVPSPERAPQFVGDISLPPGYQRLKIPAGSFGEWLRKVPVKKERTVYLFNGKPKRNQSAQFAVLDISVGKKDLQQCADAVMRLRAEYLLAQKRYSEIRCCDNAGKCYQWEGGDDRNSFERYLETVFGWCGSVSLQKQLHPVNDLAKMKPGDVFIKGGFSGHAMIVMDVAVNTKREKVFMLVQSYMPAQDIHVVINPLNAGLSPWYDTKTAGLVITPEWQFAATGLRTW